MDSPLVATFRSLPWEIAAGQLPRLQLQHLQCYLTASAAVLAGSPASLASPATHVLDPNALHVLRALFESGIDQSPVVCLTD